VTGCPSGSTWLRQLQPVGPFFRKLAGDDRVDACGAIVAGRTHEPYPNPPSGIGITDEAIYVAALSSRTGSGLLTCS